MKEKKRSRLLRGKRHWSGEEGAERKSVHGC
ncbi:hypothetical protein T11_5366 [Trichinella zimbabwensis]|uniref:Uncharacterized protein n=1 Tax=Trichinella zimbabwensis TaxID=268475 RepID=A0A0V1DLP0_9BILA|nr:hypothetical protein T11_5366 [Trichinella zimbabwensis]